MRTNRGSTVGWPRLIAAAALAALLSACGGGGDAGADASATVLATDAAAAPEMTAQHRRDQRLYRVTDLGVISGTDMDLNAGGAVLLNRSTGPVLRRGSAEQTLPTGCIQQGAAFNDRSVVGAGASRPVLYGRGGCHDLGTLGGRYGYARDVNDDDEVTGAATLSGDTTSHAFLYSRGRMRDLGTLGGTTSAGYAINDKGDVTGVSQTRTERTHAFVYRNGKMKDLGSLGGDYSVGYAINRDGDVVGTSWLRCTQDPICPTITQHAFIYRGGAMRDIDTLGSWYSAATSINSDGVVVGTLTNNDEAVDFRAFVYRDGRMQLLNDLLDRSGAGWTLLQAQSINDDGEIVAFGFYGGQYPALRAVLLQPSRTLR